MKFIKRLFAKKYTADEVRAILAKLSDSNAKRMNIITDKALAESDRLFIEWQEKSRLEREAINTQFSKSLEDYQLKPFEVNTVNEDPEYWQKMFDRIKADLPDRFANAQKHLTTVQKAV